MNEFIFDVAVSPDEERRHFPLTPWHEKQISCLTRIHLETCSPQEIPKTLKCVMLILRITFFLGILSMEMDAFVQVCGIMMHPTT